VGKPPTILDVADALGMHKSTVSLALSGKGNVSAATRARIRHVAREMGYEPNPLAQRLAQGVRNDTVCIVSGVLDVGLATEKILLIQEELTALSFEAPIHSCSRRRYAESDTHEVQVRQIKQLCRQRPRAIVCYTPLLDPAVFQELEAYQKEGGIVICYDHPAPLACDQVVFDREDNAYQAAKHLLEQGHRAVGLRTTPEAERLSGTPSDPQTLRWQGFCRALEEYGAPLREEWVFRLPTYEMGGAELTERFLALKDRPTGLCIVNDYVAMAFLVQATRAGVRVPEDLSVIGHDDQPIAALCPVPLTSATHPVREIARAVVTLLTDRLEGRATDPGPRRVVVRGDLVRRESVIPPHRITGKSSEIGGGAMV